MAAKNASRPSTMGKRSECAVGADEWLECGVERDRPRDPEPRVQLQKAVHDRVVLFGLAGAGRVDQSPTGGHDRRSLPSITSCASASTASSSAVRRHLMSGSRRTVPEPGARRVEQHAVEGHEKWQARLSRRRWTMRTLSGAGSLHGPREQIDPARTHVAGDEDALAIHRCRHGRRLAARRGARIEHPLAGACAGIEARRAATLRPG